MTEIESTKYSNENKDKSNSNFGRYNQPPEFHPNKAQQKRNQANDNNKQSNR